MPTIDQFNRNDLLVLLLNASPHIQNQHNALIHIMNIQNYMRQESKKISEISRHINIAAILITIGIMFTLGTCLISGIILTMFSQKSLFLSFVITIAITCLILLIEELIFHQHYKSSVNEYNIKFRQAEEAATQAVQYIYHNTRQHPELQIIPFDYQNNEILNIVCNYLNNFRASNWSEAINLYEQEKQLRQLTQAIYQNQQLMLHEVSLLKSIQSDINFNTLATAGLALFM